MLEANSLSKQYGSVTALSDLNLRVEPGDIFCMLGPNGSGKTTTIHLFLGFIAPTGGSAQVAGCDPVRSPHEVRRRVAFIPDQVNLYRPLTGLENLRYLTTLAGVRELSDTRLLVLLEEAGLPQEAARRRVGGYSKGMRQKVGVALAMAKEARVLLLDEPTTGLDPESTAEFGRMVQRLAARGLATFMATHDLALAAEIGTHIGFMRGGRMERVAQPEALAELLTPGHRPAEKGHRTSDPWP